MKHDVCFRIVSKKPAHMDSHTPHLLITVLLFRFLRFCSFRFLIFLWSFFWLWFSTQIPCLCFCGQTSPLQKVLCFDIARTAGCGHRKRPSNWKWYQWSIRSIGRAPKCISWVGKIRLDRCELSSVNMHLEGAKFGVQQGLSDRCHRCHQW